MNSTLAPLQKSFTKHYCQRQFLQVFLYLKHLNGKLLVGKNNFGVQRSILYLDIKIISVIFFFSGSDSCWEMPIQRTKFLVRDSFFTCFQSPCICSFKLIFKNRTLIICFLSDYDVSKIKYYRRVPVLSGASTGKVEKI